MFPAITGAHVLLYSDNPEGDRAFFRDILGFPAVDGGGGWFIFRAASRRSRDSPLRRRAASAPRRTATSWLSPLLDVRGPVGACEVLRSASPAAGPGKSVFISPRTRQPSAWGRQYLTTLSRSPTASFQVLAMRFFILAVVGMLLALAVGAIALALAPFIDAAGFYTAPNHSTAHPLVHDVPLGAGWWCARRHTCDHDLYALFLDHRIHGGSFCLALVEAKTETLT
jgi:hypothetical protein